MYLAVAFNRFKGYGSFWEQRYSATSMTFFCEQPPLYFETLGWFYKLFGGAEAAEKLFTLFWLVLTVFLLALIWKKLVTERYRALSWLPAFLLVTVPGFCWAYNNQVIETMITPLALFAFYLHLVFMRTSRKNVRALAFFGIVGVLFLLLITKGVQSVFLLAGLFLAAVCHVDGTRKKHLVQNLVLAVVFAGLSALVFMLNEKAHYWMENYFQKRLVATFNHVGATASYREQIIVRFFSELLPGFAVFLLVAIYFKIRFRYNFSLLWKNMRSNPAGWWMILISLSASMPMALTLEQRGFYLTPAFPFAVLGLTFMMRRYFYVLLAKLFSRGEKVLKFSGAALVVLSFVFFVGFKGDYKRDEGMLKDIDKLVTLVSKGEVIGIDQSTWNTFSLHSYLNKRNDNSLLASDTTRIFIQEKENKAPIPANYKRIDLFTESIDIYERTSK